HRLRHPPFFPPRRSSDLRPVTRPTSPPPGGSEAFRLLSPAQLPAAPGLGAAAAREEPAPARIRESPSGFPVPPGAPAAGRRRGPDRKSTRLNSSHVKISY